MDSHFFGRTSYATGYATEPATAGAIVPAFGGYVEQGVSAAVWFLITLGVVVLLRVAWHAAEEVS